MPSVAQLEFFGRAVPHCSTVTTLLFFRVISLAVTHIRSASATETVELSSVAELQLKPFDAQFVISMVELVRIQSPPLEKLPPMLVAVISEFLRMNLPGSGPAVLGLLEMVA